MGDQRDRQYEEYLALREQSKKRERYSHRDGYSSIEDTPYGNSDMRRQRQEHIRQQQDREAYMEARRHREENGRGKTHRGRKSKKNQKHKRRNSKGRKARKVIIALLLAAVGFAALLIFFALGALGNIQQIDIDRSAIGINSNVDAQLEGYRNIAILGVDARDMSDDSGSRTDAMVVASINEETDEIKLFSVFRDTYVYLGDEHGYDKITHAYAYEGPEGSLYALNKNLDMNIDEVVIINWKAVADVVDAVGGIDVEIQESEIEEMNKYIPETAKNTTGDKTLIEKPGMQTLNGVQAVTYSRIRKDAATGDYRRNERMKVVMQATFDKAKNISLPGIFKITGGVFPEIKSNISSTDMLKMAIHVKKYNMQDSTTGFPYDVSGTGIGGVFYGVAKNLSANVSKLHEQFFNQQGYTPTDDVRNISNEISYRTGIY